jgi:hypothetical protein
MTSHFQEDRYLNTDRGASNVTWTQNKKRASLPKMLRSDLYFYFEEEKVLNLDPSPSIFSVLLCGFTQFLQENSAMPSRSDQARFLPNPF